MLLSVGLAVTSCKTPSSLAAYQGYAKALEKALQSAKVLTQPSISSLQALIIYLSCGRLNMDTEYLCTMMLLLVRLATKLQLHQDPGELGFEPEECEHRRRLWWHIITLDVRTAEACGSAPLIVAVHIETKIPSMVETDEQVLETPERAPCTCFATMGFEMAKIARKVLFNFAPSDGQQTPRTQSQQQELSDRLHHALLTQYRGTCNYVESPLCRLTMQWCSIYWTRLKLLIYHSHRLFLRQVTDESIVDPDKDLLDCISILERVERLRSDAEYSRWAWLWQNCVEWDACAIALCMIVTGKCSLDVVSRAWLAVDSSIHNWSDCDLGDSAHRWRWSKLLAFRGWVRAASLNFEQIVDNVNEL